MARAVFRDKVGGSETLEVRPGQTIKDLLRAYGIPANAVLTFKNEVPVSEEVAVVEPDDYIEIRQVRHYDLNITRNPPRKVYSAVDPLYTKSVVFDDKGHLEVRSEQMDQSQYIEFIERTFVESVQQSKMIEPGAEIITGLSGGRDSVSFLTLLERTRDQLPDFKMTAVTVTGMPDWEEPATFRIAQECCESLGIQQVIVESEAIEKNFKLIRPFVDVMNDVVAGEYSSMIMVIGHHVMRRMIEIEAEQRGVRSVALGFNADDLVASLVTWFTSGFQMGPIPVRPIGDFTYIFPLYRISKKELTLFLELLVPDRNTQGAPGRFTTGPGERSMAYAVTDHLFDQWPGIDYYLFDAFSNVQQYLQPVREDRCRVCGATYQLQPGANPAQLCDVCSFFARQEYARW